MSLDDAAIERARRLADEAPPLTDELRARIHALLHAPHATTEKAA